MKRLMIIPAIIALIVLLFGCKKIKNLANINIDIPYNTVIDIPAFKVDTPAMKLSATLNLPRVAVATNSKETMEQYHTNPSNVRQVDLKELGLQILEPSTGNFDFVDTVQIYMAATTQPEILVAYQYMVRPGANNLDMIPVPNLNLKEYFLADTIYLRMKAVINNAPDAATKVNVKSVFHLLANPLY